MKSGFYIHFCQKCAFSQFLNQSNGIVYAGISDSTILFVNEIAYRFLWGDMRDSKLSDIRRAQTLVSERKVGKGGVKKGRLYNLGYSPLSTIMIENCLEDYPDFKTKQELIGRQRSVVRCILSIYAQICIFSRMCIVLD
jgi:hypothetical protein